METIVSLIYVTPKTGSGGNSMKNRKIKIYSKIAYSMLLTKQLNGFETPTSLFQTARNVVCPSFMLWRHWYIPPPVWIEKKKTIYHFYQSHIYY